MIVHSYRCFFSSRRRHTRLQGDWSSDVCSSDLGAMPLMASSFIPGGTAATDDTQAGRAQALEEFKSFLHAADTQGFRIFLDVPFNHKIGRASCRERV